MLMPQEFGTQKEVLASGAKQLCSAVVLLSSRPDFDLCFAVIFSPHWSYVPISLRSITLIHLGLIL